MTWMEDEGKGGGDSAAESIMPWNDGWAGNKAESGVADTVRMSFDASLPFASGLAAADRSTYLQQE